MKIDEIITSINNKKIIETNKLKNKKERYEKREYLVEGIKNVYEYIRHKKIDEIIHVYIKQKRTDIIYIWKAWRGWEYKNIYIKRKCV